MRVNTQRAPYPHELADLVHRLRYKPGWQFHLIDLNRGQGSVGLTLDIVTYTTNSYHPEQTDYQVHHYWPVPPAAYDRRSWQRWLFEQVALVERHEAMEFFRFGYDVDDVLDERGDYGYAKRPYAPSHGPGNDPYMLREVGTDEDQRTSFRGYVKDAT